jgi:hypothetical protein
MGPYFVNPARERQFNSRSRGTKVLRQNIWREVSVKFFEAGDREPLHKQILATELTAVISGIVQMNSKEFSVGAIIEFEPGEACEFLSVTDATLVCVKFPSIPNDKIVM